ncbi:MAG: 16S rRNA (adenine(1518)-N(6)/adenine(1519)-N(6))-dimethyltransferase RsmA [Vampirovibrionia bacterium]
MMNYKDIAKQFKTKKRLGQNFLIDKNVLATIVDTSNPQKDETIVEIGPGVGFVSRLIAEKCNKLIAIELDTDAVSYLNNLSIPNLEVINADVLNVQLKDIVDTPVKIVANIPYYITTPILVHLLGEIEDINYSNRELISEITLMVQKEVANRLVASSDSKNKEWGATSILAQYWSEIEYITTVSPNSFYPKPKVESAILKFKVRKQPLVNVKDPKILRKIVKASFNFRRKTLKNALCLSGVSQDIVNDVFENLNLPANVRGESLSIDQLAQLADEMSQLTNN